MIMNLPTFLHGSLSVLSTYVAIAICVVNCLPKWDHTNPMCTPLPISNTTCHLTCQDWHPYWAQWVAYHKGSNSPTHLSHDATDHMTLSHDPGDHTWQSREPGRPHPCHVGGVSPAHSITFVYLLGRATGATRWTQIQDYSRAYWWNPTRAPAVP